MTSNWDLQDLLRAKFGVNRTKVDMYRLVAERIPILEARVHVIDVSDGCL